MKKIKT